MLSFIDELRDQLWETHGDQITAYRLEELDAQKADEAQGQLDLKQPLDF